MGAFSFKDVFRLSYCPYGVTLLGSLFWISENVNGTHKSLYPTGIIYTACKFNGTCELLAIFTLFIVGSIFTSLYNIKREKFIKSQM